MDTHRTTLPPIRTSPSPPSRSPLQLPSINPYKPRRFSSDFEHRGGRTSSIRDPKPDEEDSRHWDGPIVDNRRDGERWPNPNQQNLNRYNHYDRYDDRDEYRTPMTAPPVDRARLPSMSGLPSAVPLKMSLQSLTDSPRPPSTSSPSIAVPKSRKSSCDLCHHRKIKCDQVRPSCSSCLRKGHTCHYSEETEQNNPYNPNSRAFAQLKASKGVTSPNDSNRPMPTSGWTSIPPNDRSNSTGSDGSKKQAQKRVVNGYDSDSDNGRRNDIDELDSGDERDRVSESSSMKRSLITDEISGELLELAAAPPKKKIKPQTQPGRPKPLSKPLHSPIPNTLPTPTSTPMFQSFDPYINPILSLMDCLPSIDTQHLLFRTFFADPYLTEGISLLQAQFLEDLNDLHLRRRTKLFREGDSTTLANAFILLATAVKILPEEASKLLIASVPVSSSPTPQPLPRSLPFILAAHPASLTDPTPLDQRFFDLAMIAAQVAERFDSPSVMLVMLRLIQYRYSMISASKGRMVQAGGFLAQGIRVAQALGMGKEWEGVPLGEAELRRRVMWSLYIADRHFSFETSFPYIINDAHQGIHMPSPIAESDLYKIPPSTLSLPAHSTESGPTECTALFLHTHLATRITPILDSFATVSPSNTTNDLIIRFDASLDAFQDALPAYFRLYPMTDTRFDSQHVYLAPHRVRLHATLLSYRQAVHRSHLSTSLRPKTPSKIRQILAQVCLSSLRVQRSSKMLDPKFWSRTFNVSTIFEDAITLALFLHVDKGLQDWRSMRSGIQDALELLDHVINLAENGVYVRKACGVLRAVLGKIDTFEGEERELERHRERVNDWLNTIQKEGLSFELLVREPEWAGMWEQVISWM